MTPYPYTVYRERAGNWKIFEGVVTNIEAAQRLALEVSGKHDKESVVIYCGQKKVASYRNGVEHTTL